MELLRDSVWQFVGVVLGVISLASSIIFYQMQKQRKAISCNIILNSKLVSVKEEVRDKLRVFYEGQAVNDLRLLVLRIQNSGNQPIITKDYEEPIEFLFDDLANLIDGEIGSTKPDNLRASITKIERRIQISPLLLNPGDFIDINLLVDGPVKNLQITGRVIGVSQINKVDIGDYNIDRGYSQTVGSIAYIVTGLLALLAVYVLLSSFIGWGRTIIDQLRNS